MLSYSCFVLSANNTSPLSEHKIDEIASNLHDIKLLLQANGSASNADVSQLRNIPAHLFGQGEPLELEPIARHMTLSDVALGQWDASTHIVDFIKAVVKDGNSHYVNDELSEVLSTLNTFIQSVGQERPLEAQKLDCGLVAEYRPQIQTSLPPLKAAVETLRWAKGW